MVVELYRLQVRRAWRVETGSKDLLERLAHQLEGCNGFIRPKTPAPMMRIEEGGSEKGGSDIVIEHFNRVLQNLKACGL